MGGRGHGPRGKAVRPRGKGLVAAEFEGADPSGGGMTQMSPTGTPEPVLVDALGSERRRPDAFRELLRRGLAAVPALREGTRHAHPPVREKCRKLLDELLLPDAVDEPAARLDGPGARVRIAALHARSCERCEPDSQACLPGRLALLPRAVLLLERDPDPRMRARAGELVGLWVPQPPARP